MRKELPEDRFREEGDAHVEWCLRAFFIVLVIKIYS